jgi:acetyltransferase-like isoleucine patch superfamily enzyme
MFNKIINEILHWIELPISYMPGFIGLKVRSKFYEWQFNNHCKLMIGTGTEFISKKSIFFLGKIFIGRNSFFTADGGTILVENNSRFNVNVHINASCGGKISIGKECLIGPNVIMRTANHSFDRIDISIFSQGHKCADIIIEDDVWLGSNVVILPGVKVGKGAVIGACSVVTKDIPSMAIAVGVPAKVIKFRDSSTPK